MEEIFVRKSQIVGTRVFLGTWQVWGPASRMQAKVPLKAFLHPSTKDPVFRFNSPKAYRLLITRLGAADARWG